MSASIASPPSAMAAAAPPFTTSPLSPPHAFDPAATTRASQAWLTVTSALSASANLPIDDAIKELQACGLGNLVVTWFLDKVDSTCRETIVPGFAAFFETFDNSLLPNAQRAFAVERLPQAIAMVHGHLVSIVNAAKRLDEAVKPMPFVAVQCCRRVHAMVLGASPPRHYSVVLQLYLSAQFATFCKNHKARDANEISMVSTSSAGDDDEEEDDEDDDDCMVDGVTASGSIEEIEQLCSMLDDMGALDEARETLLTIMHDQIASRVTKVAGGDFFDPHLEKLVSMGTGIYPQWLSPAAFGRGMKGGAAELVLRLDQFLYETFGSMRIKELFDIIVDFPDSMPAVHDLRVCLERTKQYTELVGSLREAFANRLLHPGANTADIITQYISTIKTLQHLDPSHSTLNAISQSIRVYLRARKDAVRCVVNMMTEDNDSELFRELRKTQPGSKPSSAVANTGADGNDGDEFVDPLVEEMSTDWRKEQVASTGSLLASPAESKASQLDIIQNLLNIFSSMDSFVTEYRSILADKLLQRVDYDTDQEVLTLELLKMRFGDNSMHNCDVMLKDLADSRRVNQAIHRAARDMDATPATPAAPIEHAEGDGGPGVVDLKILSRLFWPPLPTTESATMHPRVKSMIEAYDAGFSKLKAPRRLQWQPSLGQAKLKFKFDDGREREFEVPPLHANLILFFQDTPKWSLSDLSAALGMPSEQVDRRAGFWVANNVLSVSTEEMGSKVYTVVEQGGAESATGAGGVRMVEEVSDSAPSADDELNTVIESYVIGMLTNFRTLTLDKIDNMLKMFVTEPPYTKTIPQLKVLMDRLVAADKLESGGDGIYTIK